MRYVDKLCSFLFQTFLLFIVSSYYLFLFSKFSFFPPKLQSQHSAHLASLATLPPSTAITGQKRHSIEDACQKKHLLFWQTPHCWWHWNYCYTVCHRVRPQMALLADMGSAMSFSVY